MRAHIFSSSKFSHSSLVIDTNSKAIEYRRRDDSGDGIVDACVIQMGKNIHSILLSDVKYSNITAALVGSSSAVLRSTKNE